MRCLSKTLLLILFVLLHIDSVYSDTDIELGERLYVQCSGCHAPDYNRTGPLHCGLLGRKAGAVKEFVYTKAMKDSGIIWSKKSLDKFLTSPLKMIQGTSMGFSGIASAQQRQQLIAYLSQLDNDNAICKE